MLDISLVAGRRFYDAITNNCSKEFTTTQNMLYFRFYRCSKNETTLRHHDWYTQQQQQKKKLEALRHRYTIIQLTAAQLYHC